MEKHKEKIIKHCTSMTIIVLVVGLVMLNGGGQIDAIGFSIHTPIEQNISFGEDLILPKGIVGLALIICAIPIGKWCKLWL